MITTAIREKLHDYINEADDAKIKVLYSMMEIDFEEKVSSWEDEDFLEELDRRKAEFESGKVRGSTWEEIKAKY
ncbi:addiction module protein [Mucilaginibacter sp. ZT4R22]|uniref:Addiction module protein n=1 Tax=Mucilaginibacter pankratovii TaxID=2772110 RepID=A0ABR7WRJ7_9SPHI|nr:addiction module protein [Mucilaginibacter pankratovii]MBD1363902.1 addiction module protein [Mucilaginibacter pankratovii]